MENKCVLPFINQDYQSDSPCCLLNNFKEGRDTDQLLDDHKNNRRSRFCDGCWKTEDTGIKSKRQIANETYQNNISQTERSVSTAVIPVGNVCNLYCVTCNPIVSTSWLKKYQNVYFDLPQTRAEKYKDMKVITDIKASDVRDIHKIKHIEFIGGETLRSASLWNYLEILDKDKSFSLQTNGTVVLTQKQIDLLSSFKEYNICFSLDGYGKSFEYIRQPAKWNEVRDNIRQYVKNFGIDHLSIYVTISNLNIFYIDDIVYNLFKLIPCKVEMNLVTYPPEFSYNNLTKEVGTEVEKNNPVFFKKKTVEWNGTLTSLAKMSDNLQRQDKFSKLKFSDHLPEFFSLLKEKTPDYH